MRSSIYKKIHYLTLTLVPRSCKALSSTLYILWPMHMPNLNCYIQLFRRYIYKKIHYLNLTLEWGSHETKLSTIYIMWLVHLQSLELLRPTVNEEVHLQKIHHLPVTQFPLRFMKRCIYKKKIFDLYQAHKRLCSVTSTSSDLYTRKVLTCYVKRFRRRRIYKKIQYLIVNLGYTKRWPVSSTSCDLCTCKVWWCYNHPFMGRNNDKKRGGLAVVWTEW